MVARIGLVVIVRPSDDLDRDAFGEGMTDRERLQPGAGRAEREATDHP
jgi:hypothetical protein